MFGIVRPCRHRLPEGLAEEWKGHLCGLCLALRGERGQAARAATNHDGLLISVLYAAQARPVSDEEGWRRAGPCPLRGMRRATVARGEGARLAAVVSLVLASAKIRDHVADGDGALARPLVAAAARRVASTWETAGTRGGEGLGFDAGVLVAAVERQQEVEALAGPGTSVLAVTEPTETAVAAAFAHTAVLAGRPENGEALAEAGRLFGRVAHLLDAVEDLDADRTAGVWNPVTATGTPLAEVRRLCDDAVRGIALALADVAFTDDRLVRALLTGELEHAVHRTFAHAQPPGQHNPFGPHGTPYVPPGAEYESRRERRRRKRAERRARRQQRRRGRDCSDCCDCCSCDC
ncbi:DUF5685 family protein [Streptomyces sp. 4N509B]|uniref:DUF5685 family protein n=1 Tax=Streptomyces sp. 4N509B TaxID=3457413 RepID=UPI003FD6A6DF